MSVHIHQPNDSQTAFIAYTSGGGAFSMGSKSLGVSKIKKEDADQQEHVYWGEGDDMPQLTEDMWKKNPDLYRAIQLSADLLYGLGTTYRVMDMDGNLTNKRIPEVDEYLSRSKLYALNAPNHIYQYGIVFPQLLFNGDRSKILKTHPLVPRNCRFEYRDVNGFLYQLYLNGKWQEGATKKDKETKKFRVIDPTYYDPFTFKETWDKGEFSVVLPSALPHDDPYYPTPDYWTLKLSKWFDYVQKIPVFKDAVMTNQITVKYLIEIPYWWMLQSYADWEEKPQLQKQRMKKEVQAIENFISGYEKAGKSFVHLVQTDPMGKKYEGISFTAIDDKMKDGVMTEDGLEGTVKIFTARGLDPGIIGITPGKPGSSRSGSERREAFNIQNALGQRASDTMNAVHEYVAVFNGWTNSEQKVVFSQAKPFMQTLDKITPEGRETTVKKDEK